MYLLANISAFHGKVSPTMNSHSSIFFQIRMPRRKKSNLSNKSKNARNVKKHYASKSEEDHNKTIQSNIIAVKKYRNGQTKEEKEARLAKHRILNQLNNSEIIKEHNDQIKSQEKSQKKSQVSMRTRNSIKRKSESESKSTKKRNLRQSIEEDRSTSNNETYLEDNNNISDDFDFSDIENQQPDEDHDKSTLEDKNLDISDDFDFSLSDFETQQPHVSTQLYTLPAEMFGVSNF